MRCRQRSETRKRIPETHLQETARNEDFRLKIRAGKQRIMRDQGEVKICNLPRPEITGSWTMVIPTVWEYSQTNLSGTSAILRTHSISWKKRNKSQI